MIRFRRKTFRKAKSCPSLFPPVPCLQIFLHACGNQLLIHALHHRFEKSNKPSPQYQTTTISAHCHSKSKYKLWQSHAFADALIVISVFSLSERGAFFFRSWHPPLPFLVDDDEYRHTVKSITKAEFKCIASFAASVPVSPDVRNPHSCNLPRASNEMKRSTGPTLLGFSAYDNDEHSTGYSIRKVCLLPFLPNPRSAGFMLTFVCRVYLVPLPLQSMLTAPLCNDLKWTHPSSRDMPSTPRRTYTSL